MSVRRIVLMFSISLLLLFGASACTRERTPWPTESLLEANLTVATPEPTDTPSGPFMPRFTPHVTNPPPTSPPTPYLPTSTPMPATPTLRPATPTPEGNLHYIVQPGETLFDIAKKFDAPLRALAEINKITDPTTIKPGQELIIPRK